MFGISICTYNRADHLDRLLFELKEKTTGEYHLVVCDDGSTDATEAVCDKHGVTRLGEANRGVAWNKNRGLYALHEKLRCDWTVIIEDDMSVGKYGWNVAWEHAALEHGHINFLNAKNAKKQKDRIISGSGTVTDPYIAKFVTGQCMAYSKACLNVVGYLNPLFVGYGTAHINHSVRCGRAGFGKKGGGYLHLEEGLQLLGIPPTADKSAREKNARIGRELADQDIFTAPYLNEEQRLLLEREVAAVLEGQSL